MTSSKVGVKVTNTNQIGAIYSQVVFTILINSIRDKLQTRVLRELLANYS